MADQKKVYQKRCSHGNARQCLMQISLRAQRLAPSGVGAGSRQTRSQWNWCRIQDCCVTHHDSLANSSRSLVADVRGGVVVPSFSISLWVSEAFVANRPETLDIQQRLCLSCMRCTAHWRTRAQCELRINQNMPVCALFVVVCVCECVCGCMGEGVCARVCSSPWVRVCKVWLSEWVSVQMCVCVGGG